MTDNSKIIAETGPIIAENPTSLRYNRTSLRYNPTENPTDFDGNRPKSDRFRRKLNNK